VELKAAMNILVFNIDNQQFAINLSSIERVIRIIQITSQPHAPEHVAGIINLHGEVLPVIDFRTLIGLQPKEIDLGDQLIICTVSGKKIALWIDGVKQISTPSKDQISAGEGPMEYVVKDGTDVTLYYNLEKFVWK